MNSLASDRSFLILLAVVLAFALLLAIAIATPFGLSAYLANAIGQLAAFAVLALSLDLIWGYLGDKVGFRAVIRCMCPPDPVGGNGGMSAFGPKEKV